MCPATDPLPDNKIGVEAEFTLLRKQIMGIKRRKAERFRCPIATLGKLSSGETNLDIWCKNLSITGVGITLSHPLEIGTDVVIHLKGTDLRASFRKPSRVAHATQEIDGTWRIGCEFISPLTDEELDSLL